MVIFVKKGVRARMGGPIDILVDALKMDEGLFYLRRFTRKKTAT